MSQNLKLQKTPFQRFLDGLSKISDTSILTVEDDQIYSISSTQDNGMFLWATLKGDFDVTNTLNLPSLKKLSKALEMTGEEEVTLQIKNNNLEYKGKEIKFKYHLFDDGILNKPKLSLQKIQSFSYDKEFTVGKEFLKNLLKKSSVFNTTSKLYIYTEDDHLVWSLADRALANTDTLTIVGEDVDFEIEDPFILNLDNLRMINFGPEDEIEFRINSKIGIGNFELNSATSNLNYIVSSLTK